VISALQSMVYRRLVTMSTFDLSMLNTVAARRDLGGVNSG
jgi:hypothetical protein